jgi:ABC-type sugar transport system ATPase subunit
VLRDGKYVDTYCTAALKEEKLITAMVGRKIHFTRYEFRPGGEHILEVRNLCKKHNYKDISFHLDKGEILAFTGLVGAGRTEVAQALFGDNVQDSGEIYLDGRRVDVRSTESAMKHGIAYVPESRHTHGLILGKSLAENITVTVPDRIINKLHIINRKKQRRIVETWIEKLNIRPAYPKMLIEQFSGGNQQKTVIAKWLAYNPKLLIVDEPTHGIDIGAKSEIHKLLRDLSARGIGIIMISSELPEVLAISDRIIVMRRGRIVGQFRSFEADQNKIMNMALKG